MGHYHCNARGVDDGQRLDGADSLARASDADLSGGTDMAAHDDDRRAIYEQDTASVRYRDGQKWSRFQTASVIEGAALYVSFGAGLSRIEGVLIMLLGSALLALVFTLVAMDDRVMAPYLARIREFETAAGVPYQRGNFRPLFGVRTSRLAMGAILIFNAAVVARLVLWPAGL
ncbi:MAG: hypothetical protein QOD42_433 [Sphingomonadales bacterium]|nr:hypothetical protein [Sphingomonadales bacterium]